MNISLFNVCVSSPTHLLRRFRFFSKNDVSVVKDIEMTRPGAKQEETIDPQDNVVLRHEIEMEQEQSLLRTRRDGNI